MGLLLGWHVYLLCTGQTTIEWYNNRMRAADARKRGQVHTHAPTYPRNHATTQPLIPIPMRP